MTNSLIVLDPTWKLSYVQVAWHAEFVEDNMEHLREIVRPLFISICYIVPILIFRIPSSTLNTTQNTMLQRELIHVLLLHKIQPILSAAVSSSFIYLRLCFDACYQENSTTERWMTQIVKAAKPATSNRERQVSNLFAELNRFFESDPLSRTECPDIIAWYGVHLSLLVAKSSDNSAYCFLVKVNREGVSCHLAHGS
jgi:hypothetical protein